MAGRFMRIKRIVIPFISLVLLTSQLAGCASLNSQEFLEEVKNTDEVIIEYNEFESQSPDESSDSIEQYITQTPQAGPEADTADDLSVKARELTNEELINEFEESYKIGETLVDLGISDEDILDLELTDLNARIDVMIDIKKPMDLDGQYLTWRSSKTSQTSSQAQVQLFTDCNQTVYAVDTVNIRANYSTNSTKLGSLTRGQSITCTGTGINDASGWSRVQLSDGTIAYMVSSYLSTTRPVQQSQGSSGTQQTNPGDGPQGGGTDNTNWDAHKIDPSAPSSVFKPMDDPWAGQAELDLGN